MIAVTILGNNSATPAHGRHPTAQIVQTHDHMFLVDCGEGTQLQMTAYKIRRSRINQIFISHLHGDHYFGLIGLINTYGLNRREADLHIFSPPGLQEIIEIQLNTAHATLPFELHFHVLTRNEVIFEDGKVMVSAFPVNHRIPCYGFIFRETRNPRKLNISRVQEHNVPVDFYKELHQGKDYITDEGLIVPNEQLTVPGKPGKTYVYCADTAFTESISEFAKNADLIYHEATYLHEHQERAAQRFHSTTIEAATVAKKAKAKKLLLGHYSSMYEEVDAFQSEASTVFANTEASQEGVTYLA